MLASMQENEDEITFEFITDSFVKPIFQGGGGGEHCSRLLVRTSNAFERDMKSQAEARAYLPFVSYPTCRFCFNQVKGSL